VMLTLFVASAEQMLGLKTEIMDKSHLVSWPVRRVFCCAAAG
jgi:hypothetical protein